LTRRRWVMQSTTVLHDSWSKILRIWSEKQNIVIIVCIYFQIGLFKNFFSRLLVYFSRCYVVKTSRLNERTSLRALRGMVAVKAGAAESFRDVISLVCRPLSLCVPVLHAGVLPHCQQPFSTGKWTAGLAPGGPVPDRLRPPPKPLVGHAGPAGSGPQPPRGARWAGRQVSMQQCERERERGGGVKTVSNNPSTQLSLDTLINWWFIVEADLLRNVIVIDFEWSLLFITRGCGQSSQCFVISIAFCLHSAESVCRTETQITLLICIFF